MFTRQLSTSTSRCFQLQPVARHVKGATQFESVAMAQSSSGSLACAIEKLSPESRLKVLRVADGLIMHIMKSGLPTFGTGADAEDTPVCAVHVPASTDAISSAAAASVVISADDSPVTPVESSMLLTPKLGVLRIDYNYHAAVGDVDHPASFGYEVEYETVAGLTFQRCQEGVLTDDLVEEFKRAVAVLHEKGCDVITGDCGFMFLFQDQTVTNFSNPLRPSMILLSPLCQLPTLITGLHPKKKVAIMTANSESFPRMLRQLEERADIDISERYDGRYIVVGCQDVPHFGQQVANGDPVPYEKAEPGIAKLAQDTLLANPDVHMFLLECTELPQFANTLRFKTGRPVYTAITLANMAMAGRQSNPRFGRHEWASRRVEGQRCRREGGEGHACGGAARAAPAAGAECTCAMDGQISSFAAEPPVPEAEVMQALAMLAKL